MKRGDFGGELPTHLGATHAISKTGQQFQNRIPRELDKNLDNPRISLKLNHFQFLEKTLKEKDTAITNPRIQPSYYLDTYHKAHAVKGYQKQVSIKDLLEYFPN